MTVLLSLSGLNFSQIVKLSPASSMFDMKALTQTVTVTINETSIFQPSDTAKAQTGFRRAELLATSNDGTDPSTLGVKMLHFSIQKDAAHPLNLSHEYMFSWLETNKYDNDQWNLRGGNLLDQKVPAGDPDTLMFFGSSQYYKPGTVAPLLFQTKFTPAVWHNFGVLMDFNKKYVLPSWNWMRG